MYTYNFNNSKYILSNVYQRWNPSPLLFVCNIWGCVFRLIPISFWMMVRVFVFHFIIIIRSEIWIIGKCLGSGHEAMVCVVCLAMFLLSSRHLSIPFYTKCIKYARYIYVNTFPLMNCKLKYEKKKIISNVWFHLCSLHKHEIISKCIAFAETWRPGVTWRLRSMTCLAVWASWINLRRPLWILWLLPRMVWSSLGMIRAEEIDTLPGIGLTGINSGRLYVTLSS